MNDEDFLSCLGYNLTDSSTPCPSDSGIDLSSMELDLWSLNCGNNLSNLQRVESSLFKSDLIEGGKTLPPMESSEIFSESSLNPGSNHQGAGYSNGQEMRSHYIATDSSYFNQYPANHFTPISNNSKVTSPQPFSSPPPSRSSPSLSGGVAAFPASSSSPSTLTGNNISYSIHPTIQMNQQQPQQQSTPPQQQHHHCHYHHHGNYPNPHGNGHFSVSQGGLFPTSMSVNLSMNMTMGFVPPPPPQSADTSATPQPISWSNQSVVNYGSNGTCLTPNIAPNYYDQVYSSSPYPSPSPPAYHPYSGENRSNQDNLPLCSTSNSNNNHSQATSLEKDFGDLRHSVRSCSPLSERSQNDMNRYSYHKGKIAQELEALHDLSQSSDDNCGDSIGSGLDGKHASNPSSPPNLCRICGKTYARPSTLKTHLRTHSGERPYRCNTCNKSFSQAANLTAHIRTHSGEKPFRCPVCDRRFSQSSSVTTHMRTHSGERPYRCCMCKKAFSDSSTLTKHLRIHSGEKPYQCKLCLLRFSQSGNLNRHMRIHTNMP